MAKRKKIERQERAKVIIDMNDFLIKYAESILGPKPDLAQQLYQAGKDEISGIDQLLQDDGFGRKDKYEDIATGFVYNFYQVDSATNKQVAKELVQEAIRDMGKNAKKNTIAGPKSKQP